MALAYLKRLWLPGRAGGTDVRSADLNNMENGIYLSSAPVVTSLPSTPVDGQECNYLADAANGVMWHLVYRAAEAGSYKWYLTGGAPLFSEATTPNVDENTTNLGYTTLATPGPALTLPLAGDYDVMHVYDGYNSGTSTNAMSYQVGAAAAVDADGGQADFAAANKLANVVTRRRKTGMAAGTLLSARYKVYGGTGNFRNRRMEVLPVRVG